MYIQPISIMQMTSKNECKPCPNVSQPAFTSENNKDKLSTTLKALALSSAVAALPSCGTDEDCFMENHRPVPPITPSQPDTSVVNTNTKYSLPATSLDRYILKNDSVQTDSGLVIKKDSSYIGNIQFSNSEIYMPDEAFERDEFKAINKILNKLSIAPEIISDSYISDKFDYNSLPVQFIALNAENGKVTRFKFREIDDNNKLIFDVASIDSSAQSKEYKAEIKSSGSSSILIKTPDYETLFTEEDGKIKQFNKNSDGVFREAYEYAPSSRNRLIRKDANTGKETIIGEIDIKAILPKD